MSSSDNKRIKYTDDDVSRRVSSFLNSRHFPAFRSLDVEVHQGSVTLSGQVCSFYEKQVAITSCQHVAGVVNLIDRIVVSDDYSDDLRTNRETLVRESQLNPLRPVSAAKK